MKSLKRILTLLLALVMLTAALCGCKGGNSGTDTPKESTAPAGPVQGGELTVGIAQDLDDSLDPHKMTAAGTREILFNVFEGLVKPDENGNLIPAVASAYTIADTGDTFTFTLRDGVKFHNGKTVTVGDVVYSINRVAGKDSDKPLIAQFSAVQSVEATDDHTVVIKTAEPYLEFLSYLTAAIIPEGSMNLVQAMYLNNAYGPLADVRVRQALCYGVDRQKILDLVNDGMGSVLGSSMYPAFGKYYNDLSGFYTQDVEKAKALLAEAGYPDGFELTITVPGNYQIHVDTAQVIAEQLKAIGVKCTIQTVEWSAWLENVYKNRDYQATVVGFDTSAAMTAQSLLARFQSESGKNVCNFTSPEYDAAYAKALAETTEDAQIQDYKDCQRILAEQAAAVYVQDPCDLVGMRQDLDGYTFYPIYVMDLSRVYFTA